MMPICPKCGKYHKKSHHRRHVRTCVGWENPALEHLRKSRGIGTKEYKEEQRKKKDRRLKELEEEGYI